MVASIAYYTIVTYSFIFMLSVLPCLFKPWELGVSMYMPYKLPTDPRTVKQLTMMQAFLAVGMFTFTLSMLLCAFYAFSITFVQILTALFALNLCLGAVILRDRDTVGVDVKAMGAQLGMAAVVVLLLLYSLSFETYDDLASAAPTPSISGFMSFVGGFFIFANFAGLFVPEKLIEGYMPDAQMRPTDRYGMAQLAVFIRFCSWSNLAQGSLMLFVANAGIDYYPFVLLQIVMSPAFLGFFIAFLKAGVGFDDKAMLFWTIFVSVVLGYFGCAYQLYSA